MPAHANPIPRQWISTPEGLFAHELMIPNPVPADSGYVAGMTPVEYYLHLYKTEAGEFTFKTATNVKGIYFARQPAPATDNDMKDRWKLEHPLVESRFQLVTDPVWRAQRFVNPPFMDYLFYEEPNAGIAAEQRYLRMNGYHQDMRDRTGALVSKGAPMKVQPIADLSSRYGITWRGIRRPLDRENGIAGGEVIVYDLKTNQVLYVYRNYAFSGRTKGTPDGVWWLTSGGCREVAIEADSDGTYSLSRRVRQVLKIGNKELSKRSQASHRSMTIFFSRWLLKPISKRQMFGVTSDAWWIAFYWVQTGLVSGIYRASRLLIRIGTRD